MSRDRRSEDRRSRTGSSAGETLTGVGKRTLTETLVTDPSGRPSPSDVGPGKRTLTESFPTHVAEVPDPRHQRTIQALAGSLGWSSQPTRPTAARTEVGHTSAVQRKADVGTTPATHAVHDAAARGIASPTTALPHAERIQASFGATHDVSRIQAHVGGDAAAGMGATAFASGNHVVFDRPPDLRTAAHEAAHVIQQARGVNLFGGVGEAGDVYERHADAVADRVVAGQSAADLLGGSPAGVSSASTVQRKEAKVSDASVDERLDQHILANTTGAAAINAALRFATKQLYTLAAQMRAIVHTPPNEAGITPQLRSIEGLFATGREAIRRLSLELSAAHKAGVAQPGRAATTDSSPDTLLKRELVAFQNGYTDFYNAMVEAQNYARKDPHEQLNLDTRLMQDEVDQTFGDRGWKIADASTDVRKMVAGGHATSDPRTESIDRLLAQAIAANADATIQTARLLRMQRTKDREDELGRTCGRLSTHVLELASLLDQADKKTVRPHKATIGKMIHEVQSLVDESTSNPALAARLGPRTAFSDALRRIRARVAQ